MRNLGTNRASLLGILAAIYGLFMAISSVIGTVLYGLGVSDICLGLGGLLMIVGGYLTVRKAEMSVTDAIGVFLILYSIFRMMMAIGYGGGLWFIPLALAIPFLIMGNKYLKNTARSIVFGVFWCVVYIFVDIAYLITSPNTLDVIDILILAVLISILVSRDILIDTTFERNYNATRIEMHGRFRADLNLMKATLDVAGDWMKHGPEVAKPKMRDSLEEHRVQVAKVIEVAHGPKRKELHLNKMQDPVQEAK